MRQCAQCVGRVIRGKNDYGLMIFADKVRNKNYDYLKNLFQRYSKNDKREKLPKWIRNYFESNHLNMSIDLALYEARHYFKKMAQPFVIEKNKYYTKEELNEVKMTE